MFLGPIAAAFVHLMLSTKREFAADRPAAGFCGSPTASPTPSSGSSRQRSSSRSRRPRRRSRSTRSTRSHETGLAALFVTHPPVSERVQRLRALDPNWRAPSRERSRAAAPMNSKDRSAPVRLSVEMLAFRSERRRPRHQRGLREDNRRRPTLPGGCPPSTIGPGGLNFSVRNGKRCFPAAMTAEIVKARARMRLAPHLGQQRHTLKTP